MIKHFTATLNLIIELLSLRRIDRVAKKRVRRNAIQIKSKRAIYVEGLQTPSSLIALSVFLPVLSRQLSSSVSSYKFVHLKWYSIFTQKLIHRNSLLWAIGARKINLFKLRDNIKGKYIDEFIRIRDKKDLFDFCYRGIHIGDLVYDSYLNETHKPTLDLSDKELLLIFSDCCAITDEWFSLIAQDRISAVVVGHAVYKNGIPARVCLASGLPAYQVNLTAIYSLSPNRSLAHLDYLDYPEVFSALSSEEKSHGLNLAEKRLEQRLSGNLAPELSYMPVSAYTLFNRETPRLLSESNNLKVLIATHDFFDSPHCYGENIHEDFYKWLEAIGELTSKTPFDWYLKNHPYLRGDGENVVKQIVDSYPRIKVLPSDSTHQQLVAEGMDAALTVFGTIGSEYAYLGLKVVNACPKNPHSRYNFNFNPKNISEFNEIILNLDRISIDIDKQEILEYYYMAYLHDKTSWLFPDSLELNSILSEYDQVKQKKCVYKLASEILNLDYVSRLEVSILHAIEENSYRLDRSIRC